MNRRQLITAMPAVTASVIAYPAIAKAEPQPETERSRMIRVIGQLEAWQGWESSVTIAAKAFAAWQMRKALGLHLPDPEMAQMHIDYQRQNFESYRRSSWFERDLKDGKRYDLVPLERVLS